MKPLVDAAFRVQAGTNPPDYNSRRRNIKPITVLLSERSRFGRVPGQQQSQVVELCRRAPKRLDGSCECSLHGPGSLAASTTAIAGRRSSPNSACRSFCASHTASVYITSGPPAKAAPARAARPYGEPCPAECLSEKAPAASGRRRRPACVRRWHPFSSPFPLRERPRKLL
jgi:hypothetical protein